MLGLDVPDDRRGCLQDIHWYGGAWGYFPAYLVGAVTAAQLYVAASKAVPDLSGAIARGEFAPLVTWLRENLHRKASLLDTRELVRQATGRELGVDAYQRHLRSRYLS
jgi:carboxypeptidase Taq